MVMHLRTFGDYGYIIKKGGVTTKWKFSYGVKFLIPTV